LFIFKHQVWTRGERGEEDFDIVSKNIAQKQELNKQQLHLILILEHYKKNNEIEINF